MKKFKGIMRSQIDQPDSLIRAILLSCFLIVTSGCASQVDEEQLASNEVTEEPKTITVTSSHGTDEIEPTVVGYKTQSFDDPLESINRPIFAFNDVLYRYALIPAAQGYVKVVPKPVQTSVSHFFSNVHEPLNALNHLMQANGTLMGESVARFLINTTVGLLGFFDPADAWFDIKQNKSTLGDTLQSYGVDYGAYLVLPFLGTSDTRNGFSTVVESFASPIRQVTDNPETFYIQVYGGFHQSVPKLESYEKLSEESEDKYLFFRNLYLEGLLRDEQYKDD